jgi:hypothetical protein
MLVKCSCCDKESVLVTTGNIRFVLIDPDLLRYRAVFKIGPAPFTQQIWISHAVFGRQIRAFREKPRNRNPPLVAI